MNELQVFNNPAFGDIRAMTIDGEPWFVAADVCKALEISNPTKATSRLDEDERNTLTLSEGNRGNPNVTVVNEPGLYGLVLGSRKPEAKAFKRWIKHEVLPSIRKHGAYMTPETLEAAILNPDTLIKLAQELKAEREKRTALQAKIDADAPRVLWAQAAEGSKTGTLIREYVKFLRQQGADIGEKRMFEDLRNKGYLIKAQGRDRNKPTQKSMELGLFTVREAVIAKPDGETITRTTALLTEKGKQYFAAMYLPVATEAEPAAT